MADTIEGRSCVFLRGLYLAERGIADLLRALGQGAPPWPAIDADKAIPWVEKKTGKTLAASQRAAIAMVLRSKVAVVTGGPGVGKTTLLDAILRIVAAKGTKILLAAPTGRAAKRMAEQTGIEAKTIHRLLETDPKNGGFKRNAENRLDCDLLVIDETSMLDTSLMFALVKAIPPKAALLLVGDVDQIAVGRSGAGSRRRHQFRRHPGRAADRGVPASRREPDRRQRPSHQSGRNAGMDQAR